MSAAAVAAAIVDDVDCIVCMDAVPRCEVAAQRCTHSVCNDCFGKYLRVEILHHCTAFPRCPHPECSAAASDALVLTHTDLATTERLRYLRGLHPARARDGRRMWCVAPGCYEPLPPLMYGRHMTEDAEDDERIVECGKCGARACLGCGSAAHQGRCVVPLVSLRAQRLYAQYAVGRVAACSSCGAHVERNGGCDHMVCSRCGADFTFQPFSNVDQVQESLVHITSLPYASAPTPYVEDASDDFDDNGNAEMMPPMPWAGTAASSEAAPAQPRSPRTPPTPPTYTPTLASTPAPTLLPTGYGVPLDLQEESLNLTLLRAQARHAEQRANALRAQALHLERRARIFEERAQRRSAQTPNPSSGLNGSESPW